MQVIGFNFTKVQAEKFLNLKEKSTNRKINSNIEFTSIEKEKVDVLNSEVLKVSFKFGISYEPKLGEINFEGIILIKGDEAKIKETVKNWKDKKLPEELKLSLLNIIMGKCTLKALQLEEELSLPLHIKLPKLSKENKN